MSDFLPKDVRDALERAAAERARAKAAVSVGVGDLRVAVLSSDRAGFRVAEQDAPRLRGFVDLYEDDRHVAHCLIVAASLDAGVWHYDIKRQTFLGPEPAADFVRPDVVPVPLIEDRRGRY